MIRIRVQGYCELSIRRATLTVTSRFEFSIRASKLHGFRKLPRARSLRHHSCRKLESVTFHPWLTDDETQNQPADLVGSESGSGASGLST
jgi:hypothetical protein